jgi:hypothetical protein
LGGSRRQSCCSDQNSHKQAQKRDLYYQTLVFSGQNAGNITRVAVAPGLDNHAIFSTLQ